jgi:hypothetical protein
MVIEGRPGDKLYLIRSFIELVVDVYSPGNAKFVAAGRRRERGKALAPRAFVRKLIRWQPRTEGRAPRSPSRTEADP